MRTSTFLFAILMASMALFARAEQSVEFAGNQFQLKGSSNTVANLQCVNFSGNWKGGCSTDALSNAGTLLLEIAQSGCDSMKKIYLEQGALRQTVPFSAPYFHFDYANLGQMLGSSNANAYGGAFHNDFFFWSDKNSVHSQLRLVDESSYRWTTQGLPLISQGVNSFAESASLTLTDAQHLNAEISVSDTAYSTEQQTTASQKFSCTLQKY